MIVNQLQEILDGFLLEMEATANNGNLLQTDPLPMIALCEVSLGKMRDVVRLGYFEQEKSEVRFFKVLKPTLVSWRLFFGLLGKAAEDRPVGDMNLVAKFYAKKMEKIRAFFRKHRHMLRYYRSGEVGLDKLLFLRNNAAGTVSWVGRPSLDADPRFSTGADLLLAKIIAYERLYGLYAGEMVRLEALKSSAGMVNGTGISQIRWTGEAVNLIELAYGIYLQGQIDSSVGIVEFFERLGGFFGVKLGVPKRGFEDIKRRKRLSKTHFIDKMRDSILAKIDEEDGIRRK
ncbi:MAG: hypothetical protein EOP48_03040 [Sphingobacteriales bacterium]|nr:MAG: hypothetical protein EOP48_03040 [Sphingobacteriales bacterium]